MRQPRIVIDGAAAHQTLSLTGDEAHHLTRVLRRKVGDPVTVLSLDGAAYDGRVEEILNDGQHEFIQKPFFFKEFTDKIDAVLSIN